MVRTGGPGPTNPKKKTAGAGVVRQSSLTSVIALVSVLSGLGLDLCVAAAYGAGAETDAFVVAARLPLGLASVVMVMANQVLVPSFTTWVTGESRRERRTLESSVLFGVVLVMVALAGVLSLAAVPVAGALAPGFTDSQTALAADLIRVMAWYLPAVAAAEVLRCWLNSRFSFAVPAAMTLVLNLVGVGVILLSPQRIEIVAYAYVAGSAAQLLVMGLAAYRKGLRLTRPSLRHPEVRRTAALCLRPSLGAGLNPLVRVVELFFASFLPTGSATILHYGNRLASAVGGTIVFRSVIVALLPRLTRAHAQQNRADFLELLRLGMRIMLLIAVPMGIIGAVLAPKATSLVFGIGRFDAASAALLGGVLSVYALSFPGSGIQRALLAPFFAQRDTRTPWRNTVYGALANIVLLPALVLPFGGTTAAIYGVATAYALSQYVNVGHAWWRLRQEGGSQLRPVRGVFWRSLGGSVVAAGAALAVLLTTGDDLGKPALAAQVVGASLAGLAVYALAQLTDPRVRGLVSRRLRRRRRRPPTGAESPPVQQTISRDDHVSQ